MPIQMAKLEERVVKEKSMKCKICNEEFGVKDLHQVVNEDLK
jgi:hypothetical protein